MSLIANALPGDSLNRIDLDRLVSWTSQRREKLRVFGIAIALAVFVGGLVWSLSAVPDIGSRLRLAPILLLLLIGAPIGIFLNSAELFAMSRISRGPMSWRSAVELTIYGSAANMLPIPGGAITRLAGMKAHGVGLGLASAMLLFSFTIWGSLAFCYSAAALLLLGHEALGIAFLAAGIVIFALSIVLLLRIGSWQMVVLVVLLRMIGLPLDAVRFMLATAGLSAGVGFVEASVFSVANFTSAAVMIVPSGLGVREVIVALLSPFALLNPAVGFLVASVGRVVWMAGLALVAAIYICLIGRITTPREDSGDVLDPSPQ